MKVARCTKIINPNTDDAKYVTTLKQIAKVWHTHIYRVDHIFWRFNPDYEVLFWYVVCGWIGRQGVTN
jgi:hypothetical protein